MYKNAVMLKPCGSPFQHPYQRGKRLNKQPGFRGWRRAACRNDGGEKGFTLIELLVVVLIIGILASVAVPYYQSAVEMSRVASALAWGRAVMNAQDRFYMQNNRYASTVEALDVSVSQCPKGFSCNETFMADDKKYEINRSGGPFFYQLVFSFAFRGGNDWSGRIYCAAQINNQKGIDFCRRWGDDSPISDSQYIRVYIQ